MKKLLILLVFLFSMNLILGANLTSEKIGADSFLSFRLDSRRLQEKKGKIDYVVILEVLDSEDKISYFGRKEIVYKTEEVAEDSQLLMIFKTDLELGDYTAYLKVKSRSRGDKIEEKFDFELKEEHSASNVLLVKEKGDVYIEPNSISDIDQDFYLLQYFKLPPSEIKIITSDKKKQLESSLPIDSTMYVKLKDIEYIPKFTNLFTEFKIDGKVYQYQLRKIDNLHKFQRLYSWKDQLRQIRYIVDENEWRKVQDDRYESDKARVLDFWARNGLDKTSSGNSLQDIFYDRIIEVDRKFSVNKYKSGWETDRGRIYIKFGEPDEIDVNNYPIGRYPTQTWTYYYRQKTFYFYDRSRTEDYKLYNKEEEYDY